MITGERKCGQCGGEMVCMNEEFSRLVVVTPPHSDKSVPAELWVCGRCKTAVFVVNTGRSPSSRDPRTNPSLGSGDAGLHPPDKDSSHEES
jgi:hypothetical protein